MILLVSHCPCISAPQLETRHLQLRTAFRVCFALCEAPFFPLNNLHSHALGRDFSPHFTNVDTEAQ